MKEPNTNPIKITKWMTQADVCKLLEVKATAVNNWVSRNKIVAKSMYGKTLVDVRTIKIKKYREKVKEFHK